MLRASVFNESIRPGGNNVWNNRFTVLFGDETNKLTTYKRYRAGAALSNRRPKSAGSVAVVRILVYIRNRFFVSLSLISSDIREK